MSTGPDFVGIGVQRGGTSWLYECLKEHPDIFMPRKEVHFFDNHYDKGIDWYRELFNTGELKSIKGEITPDYINSKKAIERIYEHQPNTKIIVILREPFERTYSAVGLLRSHGQFKGKSFDEVIRSNRWVIEQSMYFDQLTLLISLFGREQVKIFFFEDIKNSPLWLLKQAYDFIGVDSKFEPTSFQERANRGGVDLTLLFGAINLVKVQIVLSQNAVGRKLLKLKRWRAFRMVKSMLYSVPENINLKITHCPKDLREEFIEDIKKTESLLNIDLKHWY